MELEKMVAQTAAAIQAAIPVPEFRSGKFSVWLKFVRLKTDDGTTVEENLAPPTKQIFTAANADELLHQLADNVLLAVFGAEAPVVQEMPNLIVKLLDKKAQVAVPGAPPLTQPDQIFLKATVYEYSPSLWDTLFGRKERDQVQG